MKTLSFIATVILLAYSVSSQAQDQGLDIAQRANLADQGKLKMVLQNRQGQESECYMETNTLELGLVAII